VSADVYYTYIKSNEEHCILISTRCCTYGQHGVVVCYLSLIQTDINSAQYFVSLLHPYSTYLYYYIAYCLLPYILHVAYCPSTLVMNRICQACKKTQLCFPCRVCSQECSYSVTGVSVGFTSIASVCLLQHMWSVARSRCKFSVCTVPVMAIITSMLV